MTDPHQLYEAECERIRTANEKLLAAFHTWLAEKRLSHKTIRQHASNIDLAVEALHRLESARAEKPRQPQRSDLFI